MKRKDNSQGSDAQTSIKNRFKQSSDINIEKFDEQGSDEEETISVELKQYK